MIIMGEGPVRNPGLKHLASPPPMKQPKTLGQGGYGVPPEPATIHEDVTVGPPLAGGSSPQPVSVENGNSGSHDVFGLDTAYPSRPHGLPQTYLAGIDGEPGTMVPGEVRQHANLGQEDAAEQRRIDHQKQVGGGAWENPAYEEAQDQIRARMQERREAAFDNNPAALRGEIVQSGGSEADNIATFIDPRHRPDPDDMWGQHGDQPMIDFKSQYALNSPEQVLDPGWHKPGETCETCYLKTGDEESPVGEEHEFLYGLDHPFKPLTMEHNQRYSSTWRWAKPGETPGQVEPDDAPAVSPWAHPLFRTATIEDHISPPGLDPREVMTARAMLKQAAESDEEFWARMEREHPGEQRSTRTYEPVGPDSAGQEFMDGDDLDEDEDLDGVIPDNMSLRDHATLLRSGADWDGKMRYPGYTRQVHREVVDSDGRRGHAIEGHVIEHNTGNRGPVLPSEDDPEPHVLQYPWSHTYYPAGLRDEEGLTKGYNTADQALSASRQLSLWGARHPKSQELLNNGYRYVGSEEPYDPSEKLPHEVAQETPR